MTDVNEEALLEYVSFISLVLYSIKHCSIFVVCV